MTTGTAALPASSGGTTGVDTIKVSKAYYADTGSYLELLVMASSSDPAAQLHVYLPDGELLGQVPNGGGATAVPYSSP